MALAGEQGQRERGAPVPRLCTFVFKTPASPCHQVVDARDPLTYRSEDLEAYALDLHPTKRSLLLLNKADLLPEALRRWEGAGARRSEGP